MKIEYSKRALADLRNASAYSRAAFGDIVAVALEVRIREAIEQIRHAPERAPCLEQRRDVRMMPLVYYPYKIFYRILGDAIRILHIRHASRRPWGGEE
jgi:toxin ParE1/3/4